MSDVVRRIARWQVKCTPERTKAGHVPCSVEIGSGPHTTLDNLACFVNLCL